MIDIEYIKKLQWLQNDIEYKKQYEVNNILLLVNSNKPVNNYDNAFFIEWLPQQKQYKATEFYNYLFREEYPQDILNKNTRYFTTEEELLTELKDCEFREPIEFWYRLAKMHNYKNIPYKYKEQFLNDDKQYIKSMYSFTSVKIMVNLKKHNYVIFANNDTLPIISKGALEYDINNDIDLQDIYTFNITCNKMLDSMYKHCNFGILQNSAGGLMLVHYDIFNNTGYHEEPEPQQKLKRTKKKQQ